MGVPGIGAGLLGPLILSAILSSSAARAELVYRCPDQSVVLQQQLAVYFTELRIRPVDVRHTIDKESGDLRVSLTTPAEETHTLDFFLRPSYALSPEVIQLPAGKGKLRKLLTASRKEIVLALLQQGRITEFKGEACSHRALVDHVGVRQNIVAWAEQLHWVWPNGQSARWNARYWKRGTPNPGVALHVAVMDAFLQQKRYAIGCYTAAKLVVVQGVLDYFRRVKPDPERLARIEQILLADGEPLVGVEPGKMWSFEADFDILTATRPGKLLALQDDIAATNFVPGDWGYLLNTDAKSKQKIGYEGSNAIYLGSNRFDDFYNDHKHSYTYEQKLDEVYQWRHGVFSRANDLKKIKSLTPEQKIRLSETPEAGGIQLRMRAVPKYF